ncbi:exoribonuclease II [Salmonella enterica subsp. enterica]|uniref:Exoribonuclease II n=1 Tax=Salmonella enterica I TaxID=59201 RepID=A0A379WSU6_SALET|nr:exoribonuclease II [Salmonella enterica subsp. enterica]
MISPFFAATIESKAKLAYDNVSDWLENNGTWQPDNEGIAQQIRLLHRICLSRSEWRHHHALVFKDRPDYRFVLGEKAKYWILWRSRAVSLTVS